MKKWRVRITIEDNVEANSRAGAKRMLIEKLRTPGLNNLGQPKEAFSLTDAGKPIVIDVSASRAKK